MVLFNKKEDCCGCTACKNICPKSAIDMVPDEEGFLYPQINKDICIECGLCQKVCTFQNGYATPHNFEKPLVYAVRHKNENELLTSRSGAMFIAISDYILTHNGIIYGAGYSDHFRVVHKRATTKTERNEFKGSKYVQSDLNETFEQVKDDLQNKRMVLYSGTPCHTSGLCSYLLKNKIDTKNLYVCDIVCHGAPSPFIWRDYISYIEKKYKDDIIAVSFRDKQWGWEAHVESFILQRTNQKVMTKTYTDLFYQHIILRPSCSVCRYTNFRRPADITLADYWGWKKVSQEFNADNKGVSLVLVNTQKGRNVFENVKQYINYLESSADKCIQPNLQLPSKASSFRNLFWKDYIKHGFTYVGKKYGNLGWMERLKYIMLKMKSKIRGIVKG
ncbi:MAG: Coenzyme F420 hydrogenase/dehydrogenase, beta subunit C-terminal domain [Chitinispirillaceae bacterium]|nr:Coenzyme F420 hydrogenase/dehydrogenase, beta subunit C-terminal domain [Chitinispirillaceae bacterium]